MKKMKTKLLPPSHNNSYDKIIDKTIKYIHKHAAGLTLLVTVSITVGSVLLKYIYYLIELGYANFFNISPSHIDIADDNIIYGIVANGVISLFYILISALPYLIWQSKGKQWCRIVWIVLITLIPEIVLIISLFRLAAQGVIYSIGQYIGIIIAGIFLGLIIFSVGYFLLINKKINTKEKNKEKSTKKSLFEKVKRTIIAFLLLIVLESAIIYASGYLNAASQNEFRIIELTQNDSYVILYETDNSYIVAECEITGSKINIAKDEHKQISKENIEYSVRQLTQIME